VAVAALVAAWLAVRPNATHKVDALSWLEHHDVKAQIAEALAPVLDQLWAQAWEAGAKRAGRDVPSQAGQYRAKWLSEVAQTRFEEIAVILAAGGTAAALAAAIAAALGSTANALRIAKTEVFRAFNGAMAEAYRRANVDRVRWVTRSANPCPICLENEAAGAHHLGQPFPSGDTAPPAHPNCECVLVPADEE
jgi:hypothetical protein